MGPRQDQRGARLARITSELPANSQTGWPILEVVSAIVIFRQLIHGAVNSLH
jgi:hypothetical protein